MRYFLSTFVSIGLLFAMLLLPLHLLLSLLGFPGQFSILVTLLLMLFLWWFSNRVYDSVLRIAYGARWVSIKELQGMHPSIAIFLQDALHKHGLSIWSICLIEDARPIAATYGSSPKDCRLIITSGIFHSLDEREQQSVVAHELGHIHYRDIAVLSTAYLPAFVLFELARVFWRSERISQQMRRNPYLYVVYSPLFIVGFFAYLLHRAFSLPVLLQSRVREYFADEFASEITNPTVLASALSKISLSYISSQEDKRKNPNLMEALRPFAQIDCRGARNLGLAYLNRKETGSWRLVEYLVTLDVYNPWSAIYELSASHPLAGKRLLQLCIKAEKLHHSPLLDMERMFAANIAVFSLKMEFLQDFAIYFLGRAVPFIIALLVIAHLVPNPMHPIGVILLLYGLGVALISLYSFSYVQFRPETVKSQMEDPNVSPIRGKPLILEGVIRDRSSLGLDIPEELIFADHSGEIFIGSRSLMPLVISPYISISSLMKLRDQRVKVRGWYLRGKYPKIIIDEIITQNSRINGRQRLFDLGLACLICSAGILFIMA